MIDRMNSWLSVALSFLTEVAFPADVEFLTARLRAVYQRNRKLLRVVPNNLVTALIAAEDRRFWQHGGVDIVALIRVCVILMRRRVLHGGSTIEQQLVRTLTMRRELTLQRKIREIFLACFLGRLLDKREIATLYLCTAYFGWCMNTLTEAFERLHIESCALSDVEAAALVARLKYPEPKHASALRLKQIETRTSYIFRAMERRGRS